VRIGQPDRRHQLTTREFGQYPSIDPVGLLRLLRLDIGEAARSFEQHLDELGLLVAQEALEFGTVDRGRHLYGSFIKSAKTVRPTLIASGIEIGKPLSSGCLRR
jgi:hypothetical protein